MAAVIQINPKAIIIGRDRKAPDPDVVRALKDSMTEVGLLNPITVERPRAGGQVYLVAGRNRLEAARQLKWDAIGCIELPDLGDVEDAATVKQLAEIAENLHRREIDAVERGELIAAWDRIRAGRLPAQLEQAVLPDGRRKGPQHRPSGVSKAARDLGISRQTVDRSLKVASLSPEAKATARVTGLANNQTALLKAAKHKEPSAQVAVLEEHVSKARPAPPAPDPSISLKTAWRIASPAGRAAFIAWLRETGELNDGG